MTRLTPLLLLLASPALADPPFKATIEDAPTTYAEPRRALIEKQVILPASFGGFRFGLTLQHPGRSILTRGQADGVTLGVRKNGRDLVLLDGADDLSRPFRQLSPAPDGRKRLGLSVVFSADQLHVTQDVEVVPGLSPLTGVDDPMRLDTVLVTYHIQNDSPAPTTVELRTLIDPHVKANRSPLFAGPGREELLNGVALGKGAVPRFLYVMERPDVKNPGQVAVITLRSESGAISPERVVLTSQSELAPWDVKIKPAMKAAMVPGMESAAVLYWPATRLEPRAKRSFTFGYGSGIAQPWRTPAEYKIALTGSFQPGKAFSITAQVDNPQPAAFLRLELPEGLRLLEGKERAPVLDNEPGQPAIVLWKASVERPGEYPIRIHTGDGTTYTKILRVK